MYDRIHLSNIPDYTGGSLMMFLVALPLIWPDQSSYITTNSLPSASRFDSAADYDSEYVCLHRPSDLEKTFQVRMAPSEHRFAENFAQVGLPEHLFDPFIMSRYHKWHHQVKENEPRKITDLMPRPRFETWLYRLFLKLSIPVPRDPMDITLIHSPVNLTILVRLCIHLHDVGYPAHRISTVLDNLLSGKITTKARPPSTDPLALEETAHEMSSLKQSTAFFVAELSTLITMWQSVIPFGTLAPNLPLVDDVRKYSCKFSEVDVLPSSTPALVLVFINTATLPGRDHLNEYLVTDEFDQGEIPVIIREKSIHVLSTWTWDAAGNTASFWLRNDVMADMKRGPLWCAMLWRTDNWLFQSIPTPVGEVKDLGVSWAEESKR